MLEIGQGILSQQKTESGGKQKEETNYNIFNNKKQILIGYFVIFNKCHFFCTNSFQGRQTLHPKEHRFTKTAWISNVCKTYVKLNIVFKTTHYV